MKLATLANKVTLADLEREARGELDPTLREIYQYIDNAGNAAYAITPNGMTGGEQGWGATGAGITPADTQANNGADGNMPQAPVTFKPHELFAPGITLQPNSPNGEGSGGYRYLVDDSKFPQTRFGGVSLSAPVDSTTDLYNPNLVYEDENYGPITYHQNVDTRSISDMIFPAIMAAATGGMGLLGAPALGTMLPGLLQSISNGSLDLGRIAGMIAQQFGIDPQIVSAILTGANLAGVDTRIDLGGKP